MPDTLYSPYHIAKLYMLVYIASWNWSRHLTIIYATIIFIQEKLVMIIFLSSVKHAKND